MPAETPESTVSSAPVDSTDRAGRVRLHLAIRGAVQGVGFRPFVYRLADELALGGWVRNGSAGVELEVEGERAAVEAFLVRLPSEKPAPALLQSIAAEWREPAGLGRFAIVASTGDAAPSAVVLPDLATCPACRAELLDPGNRRHRYPFTNCTHCGPRFSIVLGLPYDRPATTMRGFTMCPACLAEYREPLDRRFHAQPNACPACGPQLRLPRRDAVEVAGDAALRTAAAALGRGGIVALKGIGGFQLLCDARSASAVATLRARKRRPAKPLALMVRDVDAARALCAVSADEAELLASPQAPIVLLERLAQASLAPGVAPGNPRVGIMLPTSPLHHLLLAAVDFPLVATSGNLTDEPIAIDDEEALTRLAGIADLFLLHDRPIARHVDDSVAWLLDGAPQLLRRARGYAPLPVVAAHELPCLLATGAHQKATLALSIGAQVFLSQHLGDMETPEAHAAFERVALDFLDLYAAEPVAIAHDLHPDYPTTRWAQAAARAAGGVLARAGRAARELPLVAVQHHHAHLASCLAEHGESCEQRPALGLAFDGTGFGGDGTVWGGEALVAHAGGRFTRLARLRPFRLAGGEAAVHEPRRVALALLGEVVGEEASERTDLAAIASFSANERRLFAKMLRDGVRAPWTSSLGRLFDGVAALLGVGPDPGGVVSFEGESAMALEFAADADERGSYPLPLVERPAPAGLAPGQMPTATLLELDWRPLVAALLAERERGEADARIAARFHQTLADAALSLAKAAGLDRVALSGGCFQNRLLTERTAAALRAAGFTVLLHRAVPANDGGIALGQIAVAAARLAAS
ncbi:MAG: carbamoyltransferase HypF [Holophagales bacterium]|nr:MAG: carbamoyltransferase HypF [Holophagales bacterium]